MSNTAYVTGSAFLGLLLEAHQNKVKSNLIKDIRPVSELNPNCEKICVNYINGDIIEFAVNDENNSACVTLILNQKETNSDKPIKGRVIYWINKWPDESEISKIAAYLAKLMYAINSVYATLTLKQKKDTNPKAKHMVDKLPDESGVSKIAAYLARLMYVIKDVQSMYETGKFTALCMNSSIESVNAKFEMM